MAPCTDCNTASTATVSGVGDGDVSCSSYNTSDYTISSFSNSDSNYCQWIWDSASNGGGISLYYMKNTASIDLGCGSASRGAGTWWVRYNTATDSTIWVEQTTNFACNASTSRVSGTHVFGARCSGTACNGTPTVIVPV